MFDCLVSPTGSRAPATLAAAAALLIGLAAAPASAAPFLIDTGTPTGQDGEQAKNAGTYITSDRGIISTQEFVWSAARFTLPTGNGRKYTITSIEVFGRQGTDGPNAGLSLVLAPDRASEKGDAGPPRIATSVSLPDTRGAAGWVGRTGLNLEIDPGTFWLSVLPFRGPNVTVRQGSFETVTNNFTFRLINGSPDPLDAYFSRVINRQLGTLPPPCPIEFPACLQGNWTSLSDSGWQQRGSWGVRIGGFQQQPEEPPPPPPRVSEPQTLALVVSGLGLLGLAARRRKA